MSRGLLTLAILGCAAGCARERWRNADLQLDVMAPLPDLAAQVRLCVVAGPARTLGAGPDRYALPGLVAGQAAVLTVDLLAPASADTGADGAENALVLARVEEVTLSGEVPWQEAPLTIFADTAAELQACTGCPPACEEAGPGAGAEEESWLLAVRFQS
ncbi:MAG: hypothetical protein ABIO70_32665 [Pseudomonadota bacterium]